MSTATEVALEQAFPNRASVLDLSSRPGASEHILVNLSNNCKAGSDFYTFH